MGIVRSLASISINGYAPKLMIDAPAVDPIGCDQDDC